MSILIIFLKVVVVIAYPLMVLEQISPTSPHPSTLSTFPLPGIDGQKRTNQYRKVFYPSRHIYHSYGTSPWFRQRRSRLHNRSLGIYIVPLVDFCHPDPGICHTFVLPPLPVNIWVCTSTARVQLINIAHHDLNHIERGVMSNC